MQNSPKQSTRELSEQIDAKRDAIIAKCVKMNHGETSPQLESLIAYAYHQGRCDVADERCAEISGGEA